MAEISPSLLKLNQPINQGYDNHSVRNNPITPNDTRIQNIVDPTKVVRPDGKNESQDQNFAFNAESNYGTFLQNLKDMPSMTELLEKILVQDSSTMITSGLNENFASELARFMDMMKMDPEQLPMFLKMQMEQSGKFGGIFFQSLRDILNGTNSLELRTGILDFLKHYGDLASSEHLLKNMMAEMDQMMFYMFSEDSQELSELKNRLLTFENWQEGGDDSQKLLDLLDAHIKENGKLLKEEIIPFFSRYITKTKDLGKVRDIMTLVTLNTARYLNGEKEGVMQSFERLFQFADFRGRLGSIREENLDTILNRMLMDYRENGTNSFNEQFLDLLATGVRGDGGYETKLVFQNLLNALLLNESVYMPLNHIMLPININGNVMFSEIWVDPDAENAHSGADDRERNIRMLIKFDIKNVGYFDVVVNYSAQNVDLLVLYPPKLEPMEKEIRNRISQIVTGNGLSFQSLNLEQCRKPVALTDVFPKIAEGRNSVNVRI